MTADYLKENYAKSFSYNSEEHSRKWSDAEIEIEIDSDETISSEDEKGSHYDLDNSTKSKCEDELWQHEQIWNSLMVRILLQISKII